MAYKGRLNGSHPPPDAQESPLELRIGQERVDVWFDDRGIHFRQSEGKHTEGLLPWDTAMAMSLVPRRLHPAVNRSVA